MWLSRMKSLQKYQHLLAGISSTLNVSGRPNNPTPSLVIGASSEAFSSASAGRKKEMTF